MEAERQDTKQDEVINWFHGKVGQSVRLTRERSPVRAWVEPFFCVKPFLLLTWGRWMLMAEIMLAGQQRRALMPRRAHAEGPSVFTQWAASG